MKVKAVISAALLCAFAISASGCDGADIGTDNLIRPPKTVGDEAEIEQLIADIYRTLISNNNSYLLG